MDGKLSDEALWSLVDRRDPELESYVERFPDEAARVAELRRTLDAAGGQPDPTPPLPERIGPYRVVARLGMGGMGLVYEARQADPDRPVALKVLRSGPAASGRELELFRRETRALARLDHPWIARIYDAGHTDGGEPYFAMELVRGRSIDEWAEAERATLRERFELLARVCDAVQSAHEQGIVHRDLKPSNVLVDERGDPKVLDFGLARIADVEVTRSLASVTGSPIGTLATMSPEQARGEHARVDERSDVWGLGVLAYRLAADRLPHDLTGRALAEALRILEEREPARPRGLDTDAWTILRKALAKEPERRYASAAELASDLRRWTRSEPIAARPPGRGYRLAKLVRRRPVPSLLGLLLAGFLGFAVVAEALQIDWARPILPSLGLHVSPFDDLRWVRDRPEVRIDDAWYRVASIEGLDVDYVTGFAKQEYGRIWRKRFSEDIQQVLSRMGKWVPWTVDLELERISDGERVTMDRVPLDRARRSRIWSGRYAWPFTVVEAGDERWRIRFEGREWLLESVDGASLAELNLRGRGPDEIRHLYDAVCDATGRSPGEHVDLGLRDPLTGEPRRAECVRRVRERSVR